MKVRLIIDSISTNVINVTKVTLSKEKLKYKSVLYWVDNKLMT